MFTGKWKWVNSRRKFAVNVDHQGESDKSHDVPGNVTFLVRLTCDMFIWYSGLDHQMNQ